MDIIDVPYTLMCACLFFCKSANTFTLTFDPHASIYIAIYSQVMGIIFKCLVYKSINLILLFYKLTHLNSECKRLKSMHYSTSFLIGKKENKFLSCFHYLFCFFVSLFLKDIGSINKSEVH